MKFSYGRSFLSISGTVQKIILPLGKEKNCILLEKSLAGCANYSHFCVKMNGNLSTALEQRA